MAILLTGAGGLFTRLGHLFGGADDNLALLGGTATARVLSGASMVTRENTIYTDFNNGTVLPGPVVSLDTYFQTLRGAQLGWLGNMQTIATVCLIQMANADTPLAAQTLQNAMSLLNSQMVTNSNTVAQSVPTAGAQTASGSPTGNPIIVVSLKNGRGFLLEYILPETLTFKCINDAVTGGQAAGNEQLSVVGQAQAPSVFAYNWPLGSGVSTTLSAVDGSKSNSTGNMLTNSDFFTNTTANQADNWTYKIGVAGTDLFVDTANSYTTGGGSLKITGTGSALLDAALQSFNTTPSTAVGAGGTLAKLTPNTVYHVNLWLKCSATPAAGVVEVALVDGTSGIGTVFNDDQAVANSFTKSLTAVSTSFVNVNGVFRTPAIMPATTPYRLRVRLSTAIDSGKSVYIGRLSMAPATQLYGPQGPFVSVHSGSTNLINGLLPDTWTVVMGNTFGAFQREFLRFFNMPSLGIILNSNNGANTINDNLIA